MGGWGLEDDPELEDNEEMQNGMAMDNPNSPNDISSFSKIKRGNHQLPPLRSSTDDLLLALDTAHSNRILLWDSHPHGATSSVPAIFFKENSTNITLTRNYLDAGIDVCSPDVLARFSDKFDHQ